MAGVVRARGLRCAEEAFADRAYDASGRLVLRSRPGALLERPEEVAARAAALARGGRIAAIDGTPLEVRADTICVHGDTPGATALAEAIRARLRAEGIEVRPLEWGPRDSW
jgi:UPF0271 protein